MSDRITIPVTSDVSIGQGYNLVDDLPAKSMIISAKPSIRKIDYSHYSANIIRTRKDIRNFLQVPISKEMKSLVMMEHFGQEVEKIMKSFNESETDTQIIIKFVYKKYSEFIDNDTRLTPNKEIIHETESLHSFLVNFGDHFCVERVFGGMILIMLTISNESVEKREEMEKALNLGFSIVNPLIGIEKDVIEKIPKEKIRFTAHYIGVDEIEKENFDSVDALMSKIQDFRNEKESKPTLFQISLQSYKLLTAFKNHTKLIRDSQKILKELSDGLMQTYGSYFDFKNQIGKILEEYTKNQEMYEKIDINKLANLNIQVSKFMDQIWKYYEQNARGIESSEELKIPDSSLFQTENTLPKLKKKSIPAEEL
eukprot:gene2310-2778_t